MPIYEFSNSAGQLLEEYHPSTSAPQSIERGGETFTRVPFPTRVTTFTKLTPAPHCTKTQVMNGYRKLEIDGKRSSYKPEVVKKAWADMPIQR